MFDFRNIPPVVKNILFVNGLLFLATELLKSQGIDLNAYLGLHYWESKAFYPHQIITYMFMHGGFSHILFNLFAVWMFGRILEGVWGQKRFLIFYMVTGIGAGVIQLLVTHFRLMPLYQSLPPEAIDFAVTNGMDLLNGGKGPVDLINNPDFVNAVFMINSTTVGASGAVFGDSIGFWYVISKYRTHVIISSNPHKSQMVCNRVWCY